MSRIRFHNPHRQLPSSRFWRWRDLNREMREAHEADDDLAAAFDERAAELVERVEFLLAAGLSEGAGEALSALAEQDMTDFCILVDLADESTSTRFGELSETARSALAEFLSEPPWSTLAVDHDITIALALLDEVGSLASNRPWYEYAPNLAALTGRVLDRAHDEQLERFVGEYNALAERDHLALPQDFADILHTQVNRAAARLGRPSPDLHAG